PPQVQSSGARRQSKHCTFRRAVASNCRAEQAAGGVEGQTTKRRTRVTVAEPVQHRLHPLPAGRGQAKNDPSAARVTASRDTIQRSFRIKDHACAWLPTVVTAGKNVELLLGPGITFLFGKLKREHYA